MLLALIFFALGFCSCSYSTYPNVYSPSYKDPTYAAWKAEQKAQNDALLRYTQSAEYKAKYSGPSEGNKLPGARANSVVGTANDPFVNIRNSPIGTPTYLPTQNVRVHIK